MNKKENNIDKLEYTDEINDAAELNASVELEGIDETIDKRELDSEKAPEKEIDVLFSNVKKEIEDGDPEFEEAKKEPGKVIVVKREKEEEISIKKEIFSWVKMIVVAFLIALVVDKFIIVNATVPTGSMENTIMTGSRMIGFRFSYLFSEPKRGDVVVFKFPLNEKENYVKRVIGLPGETVVIKEAKVYIYKDGDKSKEPELLYEPYLKEDWVVRNDGYEFVIPKDSYLMMGDNRNNSSDARVWYEEVSRNNAIYPQNKMDLDIIYVKKDKILGKAKFTYWPLDNIKLIK